MAATKGPVTALSVWTLLGNGHEGISSVYAIIRVQKYSKLIGIWFSTHVENVCKKNAC